MGAANKDTHMLEDDSLLPVTIGMATGIAAANELMMLLPTCIIVG